MEVDKPVWKLKFICPVCEQGSSLTLLTCPSCGHVLAACDEDGTVFPDPRRLDIRDDACDPWPSEQMQCPKCGGSVHFTSSTADEIQAFGLSKDDYY